MKCFDALVLAAATASALSLGSRHQPIIEDQETLAQEQYLLELSPGETRWVTEEEKWELKRDGKNFFDITDTRHTYPHVLETEREPVSFPSKTAYNETVKPMAKNLKKENMRSHLEKFSSFYTRYYKSDYGVKSAKWLLAQVEETIEESGAGKHGVTVKKFDNPWGQFSIIATIPGKSKNTVVIGAHQDSTNLFLPSLLPAPGADDDGSGTVTILEAFRVLLSAKDIVQHKPENTIEFHWYSAEEGGLLGSQRIFSSYASEGRKVKAMLQQDMTGYSQGTLDAGKQESVGVITDYVDPGLTEFIKKVITTYCDIPYILTKCGYACSDHASASKYGYPSAFVIESEFALSNHAIHGTGDTIDKLSFDHMLQHAKMTLGLAYELGMAEF